MLELLCEFLEFLSLNKNYKQNTIRLYKLHLKDFIHYMQAKYNYTIIKQITIQDIILYIQDVSKREIDTCSRYFWETKSMSSSSIQIYINHIKGFYKRLELYKSISIDFRLIPNIKVKKPKIEYYQENDIINLSNVAYELEENKLIGLRNKIYILILYFTGCRASEVLQLKFSDIINWSIQIIGKGDKHRIVYVNKTILDLLEYYKEEREKPFINNIGCKIDLPYCDYIFTWFDPKNYWKPIEYERLRRKIKEYSKHIGISYHFHWLRHSFATKLMNKWVDLMKIKTILWHEYITTTQRYLHVENKDVEKSYRDIFW